MSEPLVGVGSPSPASVYEAVGSAYFAELVGRFYDGVIGDPVLAPLYPPDDIDGARARLTGFLVQYWGGPDDYSRERGHPRLRMRHAPFPIGPVQRDRWLVHMRAAVTATDPPEPVREAVQAALMEYFERAASAMQNQP